MDSQHTVTQVYILGDESNIQKCVKQITGATCDLQNVWTEIPAVSLLQDGLYMECLKEVQMNNDKDLNNDTHVQAFDIDTQTYSSVGLESNDKQSFSTTDEDQTERAMKADINAIVIEEETRINDDLASFIFTLFTWPALIVLAIDSTTFDIERYKGFVKELGVLASLEEAKSKLLLVDTNSEVDQEKIEGHFTSAIRKTYFTRHSHFEWCPVPDMCRKMKDMLKEMTISYANGPKSCKNMFASGQLFCPLEECDKKEIEWLVRGKQLILFKSNDEEFVCKPNMLINKLRSILAEMFKSVSSIDCILKLYRFYRYINITASKERLTDALIETGFIFVEEDSQNDTLYMLPFIYSNRMPAFDCKMYSPHANALRMTVKVDIIPAFIRGKMYTILLSKGWNILCSGPYNTQIKHSLIFCKKSHRLFVHFHVAKVYLLDLNTETSSKDTNINREYQELRKSFENELKHLKKGPSNEKNLDCHFFKVRENQEIKSVIEEEGNEWENVFEENNRFVTRDVSPWFSTQIQEVKRKLNETISDAFLAEVSNLFGKNSTLFFLSEGIPEPLLAQIEKNHKGEPKQATFQMLMEWRKQKGPTATIADLRTAIQQSIYSGALSKDIDQLIVFSFTDEVIRLKDSQEDAILDDIELTKLLLKEGRTSWKVIKECQKICQAIKDESEHIAHVEAAYRFGDDKHVIFLVFAAKNIKIDLRWETEIRIINNYSDESRVVLHCKESSPLTEIESQKIAEIIDMHSKKLMFDHKFLSAISASSVLSRHFGPMRYKHKIEKRPCIVFNVLVKGIIPLNEEYFPTELDGTPVDVREGGVRLCVNKAEEYQKNTTIGCKITSSTCPGKSGTLGGFIEHPEYGLCGITCAHVVANDDDKFQLKEMSTITVDGMMYQPDVCVPGNKLGKLVQVTYREGENGKPGVDLALFRIETRAPKQGQFPDGTLPSFNTGLVWQKTGIPDGLREVRKFGYVTLNTSGVMVFDNCAIREVPFHSTMTIEDGTTFTTTLYKQYHIKSCDKNIPFCERGDSGALVFMEDNTGEEPNLRCIGMLVGVFADKSGIVTPINAILDELKVKQFKPFTTQTILGQFGMLIKHFDSFNERFRKLEDRISRIEADNNK